MSRFTLKDCRAIHALIATCLLSACGLGAGDFGRISLQASPRSASQISLSWSEPGGAISVSPYVIARADENSQRTIARTTERHYLVAGLSPATQYCFVIRNPLTGNTISNKACATTLNDRTGPSRPDNLRATPRSPTVIAVEWQASFDEDRVEGYEVYRDGALLTIVTGPRLEDGGLQPDNRHCYRIRAFDPSGNQSAQSEEVCARTLADTEVPGIPQDIRVESSVAGGLSTLTVSWSESSDDSAIAAYAVLRDGTRLAETVGNRYEDTALVPAVTYCYSVVAIDIVGKESEPSEEVCTIESWRKRALGETGVGAAVIGIDADSVPRVAYKQRYFDDDRGEYRSTLKAGRIDGTLESETLDDSIAEAYVWGEFSLGMVLAPDDGLHIVHQASDRRDSRELRYLVRKGSQTEQYTVASNPDPLYGASIDRDSSGIFHACFDYDNSLYYASTSTGSWVLTDLADLIPGANGSSCRIAVSAEDTIHLVYLDWLTDDLRYVTRGAEGWSGELIDRQSGTAMNTVYHLAIATDSRGAVHVAYAHDFAENDLEYATNASGDWVIETVDDSGTVGYASAIAVDSGDRVFIVYEELNDGRRVRFAKRASNGWETVVLTSSKGGPLTMAADTLDRLHVLFVDERGELAYLSSRL